MGINTNSKNPAMKEVTINILAYFKSPEDANKVLEQIKSLGVTEIQIDHLRKYTLGSADQFMNPLNGDTHSQATLTLGANEGRDSGILLSTDVNASGMSDGEQDPITGRDIILGAVVNEAIWDRCRQLIREGDGLV